MKKLTALALILALVLSLSGCAFIGRADGNTSPTEKKEEPETSSPTVATEPPETAGGTEPGPSNKETEGTEPLYGVQNEELIIAFEKALEKLDAIETPLDNLPEFYRAAGTMTYVDDEEVAHDPSPISFQQGSGTFTFSAPEKWGDDRLRVVDFGGIEPLKGAAEPHMEAMELTALEDGKGYTGTVSGANMAALLSDVAEALPAIPFLYALISGDERGLDPKSAFKALEGGEFYVTFTVTDGVLTGIDVAGSADATMKLENNAVSIEIEKLGSLTVDLNNGIHAEGTLSYGDSTKLSLDVGDDGSLSYIHYSTDVTGLAVEGQYDFKNLTFTGYALTGNRGDMYDLDLEISNGAEIPLDIVVLTRLSREELHALWEKLAGE